MVKKYHVHIYKVIEKMEVDTLAYNAVKQGLLEKVKSDCSLIAMEFEEPKLKDLKREE